MSDLSHLDQYYLGGPPDILTRAEQAEYSAWQADFERRLREVRENPLYKIGVEDGKVTSVELAELEKMRRMLAQLRPYFDDNFWRELEAKVSPPE